MPENIAPDTPLLTVPELVDELGLAPGKIHRLIEDHQLAAIRHEGVLKVPAEFIVDGHPLPPLRGTLLVLLDAGFAEDEAVSWLLAHNEELGERPIAALRGGRKSSVRRATQALAF
ncbi:Rv2175c family DNA-binding protein [Leucobacter massiliensis]|uniref:DNA-binding protein n=1 Tax=Leucobacter massiliensis TaxID=1686285 RepID=A0A2S9QQC8_9MICO|nr:Rv2175c family DNA-binding protein [Leucobacter massiliensis]PRI11801.1 DNA-binding protein [Leucobacter massiliensis]